LNFNKSILSYSEADTFRAGALLGEDLRGGELIGLEGDLGAGKTVLVKGLASAIGIDWEQSVDSPTFKIINTYPGQFILHHVDLYRLTTAEDILGIGFFDLFGSGKVICVEWAERLGPFNLHFNYHIKINHLEGDRREILIAN
jgi:tRNA threonylcarbamoyladenosine biosynthesis protein TsaE